MHRLIGIIVAATSLARVLAPAPAGAQVPVVWKRPVEAIQAEAYVSRTPLRPGDTFMVAVRIQVQPGWHIYSNPKGPSPIGQEVRLIAGDLAGFTFEPVQYPRGERLAVDAKLLGIAANEAWNWVHHGAVVVYLPGRVGDEVGPGEQTLPLQLRGQVCDDRSCIPYFGSFQVSLVVAEAGAESVLQHEELFSAEEGPAPSGTESRDNAKSPVGQGALKGVLELAEGVAASGRGEAGKAPEKPASAPGAVPFEIKQASGRLVAHALVNQHPLRPGDEFLIGVRLNIEPGWHVTANPKGPGIGQALRLIASKHEQLTFGEPRYPSGERFEQKDDWSWVYHDRATVVLPGKVHDDAAPGTIAVKLRLIGQVCNDQQCIPFSRGWAEIPLVVAEAGAAASQLNAEVFAGTGEAGRAPAAPTQPAPGTSAAAGGLWGYLLTCLGVGFLAALTPCFYPMIPVTVSFFLKQGEQQEAKPLVLAGIYSTTIVVSFTGAGLLFGAALGKLGANPYLNLAFAALLIGFGMSLIGMFDIPIPQGLARWSSKGEAKGGLVGVMFMALTLLIVGTPCIAPFWGPVLVGGTGVSGLSVGPLNLALALGALTFSLALATPFFALALAPGLVGKLPKSGGWMTTLKVVMGFLLMGLALKYLLAADAVWGLHVLSRPIVLSIWFALALVTGMYLLGVLHIAHDSPTKGISGVRLLSGTVFLGLSLYVASGMVQPLHGSIEAFFHGEGPRAFAQGVSAGREKLEWHDTTYERGLALAKEQGRPVFLDFTGVTCYNCQVMATTIFPQPEVASRLEQMVLAALYTDRGSTHADDDSKNLDVLNEVYQAPGPPFYVVLSPEGNELGRFAGLASSAEQFAAFLDEALSRWKQGASVASEPPAGVVRR